jgi:hypothetical protein
VIKYKKDYSLFESSIKNKHLRKVVLYAKPKKDFNFTDKQYDKFVKITGNNFLN